MGVAATAKVITSAQRNGRPKVVQPGNKEWVTSVEAINATGWALPPMIIFAGKVHQSVWYDSDDHQLPSDWVIALSDNGWTNDALGLFWLKNMFDKHTKNRTIGPYRLLILDGHGSHSTAEFDRYCSENSIIALCMPPHSSHLLQPLDVACFSVLKQKYGNRIAENMQLGINHIDKQEFLAAYPGTRAEALNTNNIKAGFTATGLIPFNPS
jgi:hypothetical protein